MTSPEELDSVGSTTWVSKSETQDWPRIKDLPAKERTPFRKFLGGQTVPLIPGVPEKEQDGYYPWDYLNWKRQPHQRFFD